ncbi:MAG TPA: hypothetical protein ENN35_02925, partial [Deltaproteobacteria bacterium]|nr:hypothetical protein [Deltaproteobacteria bacterium]
GLSIAASGGVSVSAIVGYNEIDNTIAAEIKNAAVESDGAMSLAALSDADIFSFSGGVAASGVVSAQVSTSINTIQNEVTAAVSSADISAGGLSLTARDLSTMDSVAVGVSGSGVAAAGAAVSKNLIDNTVAATIDYSTIDAGAGGVSLFAESPALIRSFAAGIAGSGFAGGQASVTLNEISNAITASIDDSTVQSTGTVSLTASDEAPDVIPDFLADMMIPTDVITTVTDNLDGEDVDHGANIVSFAGTIALAGGVAGSAAVAENTIENTVTARVIDSDVTSTVGDITSEALSGSRISTLSAGIGVAGGLALNASVSVNTIDNEIESSITGDGDISAHGTLGLTASDDSRIDALTFSVAGALVGALGGAVVTNTVGNDVSAFIEGSSNTDKIRILSAGDVSLAADSRQIIGGRSIGATVGAVAAGASVSVGTVSGSTRAYIGDYVEVGVPAGDTVGGIVVSADADPRVHSETTAISAGIGAGSGNDGRAIIDPTVEAYISGTGTGVTVTDVISVSATVTPEARADTWGVNAGGLTVGVSLSEATVTPDVNAYVGGNITAGSLLVSAEQNLRQQDGYSAEAEATGSGGALIGVDATDATATNDSTIHSYVLADATLNIEGAAVISAENVSRQRAEADSNVGGVVAVGVSSATASSDTETKAWLGAGVNVTGGSLSVTARGNDDNLADTTAGAFGGIPVSSATATTVNTSTTRAEIGNGSTINLLVPATHTTDEGIKDVVAGETVDVVNGFTEDGLTGNRYKYIGDQDSATYTTEDGVRTINPGDTVDVLSNHDGNGSVGTRYEYVGDGPLEVNLARTDFLAVDSNYDELWSDTGLGRSAKAGVDLENEDFTNTSYWLPIIEAGAPGDFRVVADHTATFDGVVSALAGGLFGGTGAEIDNTVTSTVDAEVGDNVDVTARDILMDATNRARKNVAVETNIDGEAGGIVAGGEADSETDIDFKTRVTVGDGSSLEVAGSISDPGDFRLRALNDLVVKDKIDFTAGGGLSGLGAYSTIKTSHDLARVDVGDADLLSVGGITISARGTGDVSAKVNAEAYGLGTVIVGKSVANVCPTNEVIIGTGAYVRALGDLDISAGTNTSFVRDDYAVEARLDTFAGSAIPIEDVDAAAYLFQENTINVKSGALLETARSVNLHAEKYGFGDMTGVAKAVNWVSSLADALNGEAAEEMVEGTVRTESHGTVTIDGTVRTGIMRHWSLTLDEFDKSAGEITASGVVDGGDQKIGFTLSREVLKSDLVRELENAQSQLALYENSGKQTLIDYYESEIARLEELLEAEGLVEKHDGDYTAVEQYVMIVNIDPVWAEAGGIDVRADQLKGSGTFDAPGDASITIHNHTPAFVRINGMTIPESNGGLFFNGVEVTENSTINTTNTNNAEMDNQLNFDEDKRLPTGWGEVTGGGASFAAIPDNALSEPSIYVENDFVAGHLSDDEIYPWP